MAFVALVPSQDHRSFYIHNVIFLRRVPNVGTLLFSLRLKIQASVGSEPADAFYYRYTSAEAIYRWPEGKNLPTLQNLYAISQILGISINELLVTVPA